MRLIMTRAHVKEAFKKSLTPTQNLVWDAFDEGNARHSEDYRDPNIPLFSRFFGMDLINSGTFDESFKWVPISIGDEDIIFTMPHDMPLFNAHQWLFDRFNEAKNIITGETTWEELDLIYEGRDNNMGWEYDYSDLAYFIGQTTAYIEICVINRIGLELVEDEIEPEEEPDLSGYVTVQMVMMSHLSDIQETLHLEDIHLINTRKVNFVKWLMLKYPNTSTLIEPTNEWIRFTNETGAKANIEPKPTEKWIKEKDTFNDGRFNDIAPGHGGMLN